MCYSGVPLIMCKIMPENMDGGNFRDPEQIREEIEVIILVSEDFD